jgi:hypothetical protein
VFILTENTREELNTDANALYNEVLALYGVTLDEESGDRLRSVYNSVTNFVNERGEMSMTDLLRLVPRITEIENAYIKLGLKTTEAEALTTGFATYAVSGKYSVFGDLLTTIYESTRARLNTTQDNSEIVGMASIALAEADEVYSTWEKMRDSNFNDTYKGGRIESLELPEGVEIVAVRRNNANTETTGVLKAGRYVLTAAYGQSSEIQFEIEFIVAKASIDVSNLSVPELSGVYSGTLSNVSLGLYPGWTWENGNEKIEVGEGKYWMVYTPFGDTENYNTVRVQVMLTGEEEPATFWESYGAIVVVVIVLAAAGAGAMVIMKSKKKQGATRVRSTLGDKLTRGE